VKADESWENEHCCTQGNAGFPWGKEGGEDIQKGKKKNEGRKRTVCITQRQLMEDREIH